MRTYTILKFAFSKLISQSTNWCWGGGGKKNGRQHTLIYKFLLITRWHEHRKHVVSLR